MGEPEPDEPGGNGRWVHVVAEAEEGRSAEPALRQHARGRTRGIVFSFYGTRIQGIGVATARAETAPKPDFGPAGQSNNWSHEGWLVEVNYTKLDRPFRPKDQIELIRPLLPSKYSPLRDNGDGLQSVYLAEISEELANALVGLADAVFRSTSW